MFMNQIDKDIFVNCLNVSSSSMVTLRGDGNVLVGNVGISMGLEFKRDGEGSWREGEWEHQNGR